jgi:hypothetical protein
VWDCAYNFETWPVPDHPDQYYHCAYECRCIYSCDEGMIYDEKLGFCTRSP